MRSYVRYLGLFLALTIVVGTVIWLRTEDWMVYGDAANRAIPKFKLTVPEQLFCSAVIAALFTAPLTIAVFVIRRMQLRTK